MAGTVNTLKGFLNECALLARWHRHMCTLLICILGVCRHTFMIPRGINHTILYHTCPNNSLSRPSLAEDGNTSGLDKRFALQQILEFQD